MRGILGYMVSSSRFGAPLPKTRTHTFFYFFPKWCGLPFVKRVARERREESEEGAEDPKARRFFLKLIVFFPYPYPAYSTHSIYLLTSSSSSLDHTKYRARRCNKSLGCFSYAAEAAWAYDCNIRDQESVQKLNFPGGKKQYLAALSKEKVMRAGGAHEFKIAKKALINADKELREKEKGAMKAAEKLQKQKQKQKLKLLKQKQKQQKVKVSKQKVKVADRVVKLHSESTAGGSKCSDDFENESRSGSSHGGDDSVGNVIVSVCKDDRGGTEEGGEADAQCLPQHDLLLNLPQQQHHAQPQQQPQQQQQQQQQQRQQSHR